ncbi:uncharacterized protein LOC143039030 [Oratosquilla oratoria]|uniref:uncharacterized protein LOC143039030 n=1 Tax=Oratosquilla oratoria TaxID=337810 RepID=UPI003F76E873
MNDFVHNLNDEDNKFFLKLKKIQLKIVKYIIAVHGHGNFYIYDSGEDCIPAPLPKPGRPRKTTFRIRKLIDRQVRKDPRLTARLLKEKNPNLLGDVSIRSIQQLLHNDLNYKSYRTRTTPWVTRWQVVKRLKFAKKNIQHGQINSGKQSSGVTNRLSVTGTPAAKVYRKAGDDPLKPRFTNKVVKHPALLVVRAGFTYYGVGKLIVLPANEKVNQYNYLELLADYLPDCFEETKAEVFMQDGAPTHTVKPVTDWLRDCEVNYIKD